MAFTAHQEAITQLHSNGAVMSSSSSDETTRVYDVKKRQQLCNLMSHNGPVTGVQCAGGVVEKVGESSGKSKSSSSTPSKPSTTSRASVKKSFVVTTGRDGKVNVWRGTDWANLKQFSAFKKDGGKKKTSDAKQAKKNATPDAKNSKRRKLDDGNHAVDNVDDVDVDTAEEEFKGVVSSAIDDTGLALLTLGNSGQLRLWDLFKGTAANLISVCWQREDNLSGDQSISGTMHALRPKDTSHLPSYSNQLENSYELEPQVNADAEKVLWGPGGLIAVYARTSVRVIDTASGSCSLLSYDDAMLKDDFDEDGEALAKMMASSTRLKTWKSEDVEHVVKADPAVSQAAHFTDIAFSTDKLFVSTREHVFVRST